LARRIVFHLREGSIVQRGQRVGLIKFGSRVDLLLPPDAQLRVKVGDRVKGGSSVVASMVKVAVAKPPIAAPVAAKSLAQKATVAQPARKKTATKKSAIAKPAAAARGRK